MKLSDIIQKTNEAFRIALENSEASGEMVEAHRLLQGLLAAELRRRSVSRELDPFSPNTHHMFEYRDPEGPQGQRFSFVRRKDLTTTHPIGTRGWYHTEEACVEAMWEDHDELMASSVG